MNSSKSVHLENFPDVTKIESNASLVFEMDTVREVCSAALSIRKACDIRVRQPLQEVSVVGKNLQFLHNYSSIILEETNIKQLTLLEESFEVVEKLQINLRQCAPRLGQRLQTVLACVRSGQWQILPDKTLKIAGEVLQQSEYTKLLASREEKASKAILNNSAIVILNCNLTEELEQEGLARDLVRIVQQCRKDANFNVSDKILCSVTSENLTLSFVEKNADYIKQQILATRLQVDSNLTQPDYEESFDFFCKKNGKIFVSIKKA